MKHPWIFALIATLCLTACENNTNETSSNSSAHPSSIVLPMNNPAVVDNSPINPRQENLHHHEHNENNNHHNDREFRWFDKNKDKKLTKTEILNWMQTFENEIFPSLGIHFNSQLCGRGRCMSLRTNLNRNKSSHMINVLRNYLGLLGAYSGKRLLKKEEFMCKARVEATLHLLGQLS